jgi:hypothetical protein
MTEKKSEYITEHQFQFSATATPLENGKFEILCITAGSANGWEFPPEVLQQSLTLWQGAHCFIDHAWASRSVRDLAGQISNPIWDEQTQGIKANLKAFGPGAEMLTALGREFLSDEKPPNIGFSADILFTANNKTVKEIIKVISLDLVYDPARGGAFLCALNSHERPQGAPGVCKNNDIFTQKGINLMTEPTKKPYDKPAILSVQKLSEPEGGESPRSVTERDPILQQLQADQAAMRAMLGEQERQEKLNQALEEAQKTRVQMCGYLLESALGASKLPKPVQDRLRNQFSGKVFETEELQTAIEDHRAMLSELTAAQTVSGPGRITAMFNETDKLQTAVDDLFGVQREEKLQALEVPKLSGIRELYLSLTGDYDLHGGYHPDRVHLATTADFTGLVKNALNKIVAKQWELLGRAGYDWWKNIVSVEHFNSLNTITGTLVGTVGTLPEVAEGADYTELAIGDSPETADFTKYGGYIPLTLELIDRDETRKLNAYARELGSAGHRKISALVAAIFTDNSGVGPTMADTGALFNATAVTTAGGHANLLTTALAIDAWEAACTAVYNQPMLIKNAAGYYGTGPKMAINPKFCLVPRALQNTAWQMLKGEFVREATYVYDNVLKGSAVPVTVPEWTDTNNWAAVCDPAVAPAIFVGERFGLMPEIFIAGSELSPAVFTNDEHRLKVRHFLSVWVNDFRPLHKSNVA